MSLFSVVSPPTGQTYPFKEPIIIPLTKYFCTNGYTIIIGRALTIMLADFIVASISPNPSTSPPAISLAF